jgi:hypothetical protein
MNMGILQDNVAGDVGSVPRCNICGSEQVVRDAWACWNPDSGLWELENVLDHAHCHKCEGQTKLEWSRSEAPPHNRVRELNDQFRTVGIGNGSIMITAGVQTMGEIFMHETMLAVREFTAFSEDNDPWGEHDFGALEIDGTKVFWKLDYYDPTLTAGSENPANDALTHRVLTIMLASEY